MAVILGLDVSYVLPAILFTLLAVIIGSSFFKKPKPTKKKQDAAPEGSTEKVEPRTELPEKAPIVEHKEEIKAEVAPKAVEKEPEVAAVAPVVEEIGVVEEQPAQEESVPEEEPHKPEEEPMPELISETVTDETEPEPENEQEPEGEPAEESPREAEHDDGSVEEDLSPKYSPGKKRTTQFEEMMTKEELEEEQRVELTTDLTSL
ncbi:hypothetical protein GJAV_G00224400 [Gymnothorax javanicus]|nr:hypothetical protein GJAV_G00224400 [Gymnothorax javanicus]